MNAAGAEDRFGDEQKLPPFLRPLGFDRGALDRSLPASPSLPGREELPR